MKLLRIFLSLILAVPFVAISQKSNTHISIVNKPTNQASNSFYLNNRAPLVQARLIKLPVGSIQPKGWLLEYLKRQQSGLTGNLMNISAWLQKADNAWLSKNGKGKYGWEEVPYWLKGFGNIGYLLNDPKMIAETKFWIDGVLNSQRPDGDFGAVILDKNGAEDFWAKMIMLYCLQSYYEYTKENRVIAFMSNFFNYQLNYPEEKFMQRFHYWQGLRTGDNLHSVIWLYNITGEKKTTAVGRKNSP